MFVEFPEYSRFSRFVITVSAFPSVRVTRPNKRHQDLTVRESGIIANVLRNTFD